LIGAILGKPNWETSDGGRATRQTSGGPVIIFDCNGVLVDSEPIAAGAMSDALKRVGLAASAETVMRRFHGLRPADICAAVETAARRRLPSSFPMDVAAETLHRLRAQLRSIPHAEHA
jgi:beta-phosphoglucomutase-like phosphatase (HAD superfamily)